MPKIINELHNKDITWINIAKQGKKEIDYLKKNYNFYHLDLRDCLPPLQRPKLVERKDYLFLILLFPIYDYQTGELRIAEVDFFITPKTLITIHDNSLAPLKKLFETCLKNKDSEKEKFMDNGPLLLLYEIMHQLLNYCFPILTHISDDLDKINDKIFAVHDRKMVKKISNIKLNIVNYRKSMQTHKNVIKKLIAAIPKFFSNERDVIYFEHLKEKTKEIWDMLENDKDTVNALSETYDALLSFRINDIIKTLTIFSVIVFPLTLLAAIFGMNVVKMPLVNLSNGFWIIIGIMFLGTLSMLLFFKKKKWL